MNKPRHCFIWGILALGFALQPCATADEPQKVALLVGVSNYFHKKMEDLKYAENDVVKVGQALKRLGFRVTTLTGRAASRKSVDDQIDRFLDSTRQLEKDDIVFVMFSGHGQQLPAIKEKKVIVDDQVKKIRFKSESPFFCPRNAIPFDRLEHDLNGKSEMQIAEELNLISLNRVIAGLDRQSNSRQNLLVVDACRNNPAKGKSANITGSTTQELPNGLSILFAAKSGQKSWESSTTSIKHGVMCHYLIEGLKGKAKNRRNQVTWKRLVAYVSEEVDFDGGKLAGASDRKQNPQVIGSSSSVIVLGSPVTPALLNAPFSPAEIDAARTRWADYLGTRPSTKNSVGLEMVLIPGGKFTMGNPYSDQQLARLTGYDVKSVSQTFSSWSNDQQADIRNELIAGKPLRTKTLEPFLMSKTEITFELFSKFAKETQFKSSGNPAGFPQAVIENGEWVASKPNGGAWNKTGFKLHDQSAVRNVTAEDANRFCQWLSRKTGRKYRLPTETEWEYVAKAGSKDVWYFGNDKERLNSLEPKITGTNHVPSVGAERPNPFGINEMLFGVYEICQADHPQETTDRYCKKGGAGPILEYNLGGGLSALPFRRGSGGNLDKYADMWTGFRVVCEVE